MFGARGPLPRLGAESAELRRRRSTGLDEPVRPDARAVGSFLRASCKQARSRFALPFSARWRKRISRPRFALSAGRPAWAVGSGRSRRFRLDRRCAGPAFRCRARSSTKCTSAPLRPRARGRPRAASWRNCMTWASPWSRSCRWRISPASSAGATTASDGSPRSRSTAGRTIFAPLSMKRTASESA